MKIEEDIRKIIIKDIKNLGYILWGLELSGKSNSKHIRIYIDNEDSSIGLGDCEKVNLQIKDVLENTDLINFNFSLEISSPGIERTFFNIDQLKNFKDQTILVKYEEDSRKDSVLGKLLSVSDNHIEIMNNKMESIKISADHYITSKLIYKG
jgi:ribosome maturation factor RimP